MGALDVAWCVLKEEPKDPPSKKAPTIDDFLRDLRRGKGLDLWSNADLHFAIDEARKQLRTVTGKTDEELNTFLSPSSVLSQLLDEQKKRIEAGNVPHAASSVEHGSTGVIQPDMWDKPPRFTDAIEPTGDREGLNPVRFLQEQTRHMTLDEVGNMIQDPRFRPSPPTRTISPNTDPYRTVYGPFGRAEERHPDDPRLYRLRDFQDLNMGEPMDTLDATWQILKMPNRYGEQPRGSTYSVHPHVWKEAGGAIGRDVRRYKEMWTIDELEEKLGRRLTPEDFSNAPINWDRGQEHYGSKQKEWFPEAARRFFPKEEKIIRDRLGGDEGMARLKESWEAMTLRRDVEGGAPDEEGWQRYINDPSTMAYKYLNSLEAPKEQ